MSARLREAFKSHLREPFGKKIVLEINSETNFGGSQKVIGREGRESLVKQAPVLSAWPKVHTFVKAWAAIIVPSLSLSPADQKKKTRSGQPPSGPERRVGTSVFVREKEGGRYSITYMLLGNPHTPVMSHR